MKLQKSMNYRFSFFSATFVDGSMFLVWLLMFQVIYGQVDTIGGWTQGQMTIFLGTFSLLNAINMTLYFFGILTIPEKIQSGTLDIYLTKPFNPLLRITFENINPGSFPLILLSVGIIWYGISLDGIHPSAVHVSLYSLFILFMTLLYYDLSLLIRTLTFFFLSSGSLLQIEGAAFDLCMRVPGVLFKGGFKFLFYILLPYGIMATVPTQILTGTASLGLLAGSLVSVAVFTLLALQLWKFGLRQYKSASS